MSTPTRLAAIVPDVSTPPGNGTTLALGNVAGARAPPSVQNAGWIRTPQQVLDGKTPTMSVTVDVLVGT